MSSRARFPALDDVLAGALRVFGRGSRHLQRSPVEFIRQLAGREEHAVLRPLVVEVPCAPEGEGSPTETTRVRAPALALSQPPGLAFAQASVSFTLELRGSVGTGRRETVDSASLETDRLLAYPVAPAGRRRESRRGEFVSVVAEVRRIEPSESQRRIAERLAALCAARVERA